jgi:hypothetical protein
MIHKTNAHDYLDSIGAEPPPVDQASLDEAKKKMIIVHSIEEAVDVIVELDSEEESQ